MVLLLAIDVTGSKNTEPVMMRKALVTTGLEAGGGGRRASADLALQPLAKPWRA